MAFSVAAHVVAPRKQGANEIATAIDIALCIPIVIVIGALGLNGTYTCFSPAASYAALGGGGAYMALGAGIFGYRLGQAKAGGR